jgi:hypothetical protein
MKKALTIARRMNIEGQHLHNCFADRNVREMGWKMTQTARRICRRLGLKPEAVL